MNQELLDKLVSFLYHSENDEIYSFYKGLYNHMKEMNGNKHISVWSYKRATYLPDSNPIISLNSVEENKEFSHQKIQSMQSEMDNDLSFVFKRKKTGIKTRRVGKIDISDIKSIRIFSSKGKPRFMINKRCIYMYSGSSWTGMEGLINSKRHKEVDDFCIFLKSLIRKNKLKKLILE